MSKTVRLVSGTDILDLRDKFGDATDTLNDGRAVPRFVFYALDGHSLNTDPALRGRAVEVEDAQAEELLTFPNLVFEETNVNDAAADTYRRTLVRNTFGQLLDPRAGTVVAEPGVTGAALPAAAPIATLVPRTADEVATDVTRELGVGDGATAIDTVPTDATPTAQ